MGQLVSEGGSHRNILRFRGHFGHKLSAGGRGCRGRGQGCLIPQRFVRGGGEGEEPAEVVDDSDPRDIRLVAA